MEESLSKIKRARKEHFQRHAHNHGHGHAHRLSEHSHQFRRVQPRILQNRLVQSSTLEAKDSEVQLVSDDTATAAAIPNVLQLPPPALLPLKHEDIPKFVSPTNVEPRGAVESSLSGYQTSSSSTSYKHTPTETPYSHRHHRTTMTESTSSYEHSPATYTQVAPETTPTVAPVVPLIISIGSAESVYALPTTIDLPSFVSSLLQDTTIYQMSTVTITPSKTSSSSTMTQTSQTVYAMSSPAARNTTGTSTTLVTSTSASHTWPTWPAVLNATTGLPSSTAVQSTSQTTGEGGMSYSRMSSSTATSISTTPSSPPPPPTNSGTTNSMDSTAFPTPIVVGSVIGGLAGFIAILLLILFLIRLWKRKHPAMSATVQSREPGPSNPSGGQDHAAPAAAFLPGAAAAFVGRFGQSRSAQDPPTAFESNAPSFQRISGRKLPSQFSPGIQGPTVDSSPDVSTGTHFPSGSSAYPSGGTFSTVDTPENPFTDANATSAAVAGSAAFVSATSRLNQETDAGNVQSGPARTPIMHSGNLDNSNNIISRSSYLATPRQINENGVSRSPTPTSSQHIEGQGLNQGLGMGIGFARGGAATPPRRMGSRTVSYDGSVRSGRANSRFYEEID